MKRIMIKDLEYYMCSYCKIDLARIVYLENDVKFENLFVGELGDLLSNEKLNSLFCTSIIACGCDSFRLIVSE